jgi:hypothetical protein
MNLETLLLTTALTGHVSEKLLFDQAPQSLAIEADFVYGSGGTSVKAWVQTSLDGGESWIDIANFAFATTSAKKVANLSSLTPVSTLYTPTDGSLADNTVKDGILGPMFRVKTTSVGTYAGGTTLDVHIVANGTRYLATVA